MIEWGWICKCGHPLLHDFSEGYLHILPVNWKDWTPKKPIPTKDLFKAAKKCPHCDCNEPCPAPKTDNRHCPLCGYDTKDFTDAMWHLADKHFDEIRAQNKKSKRKKIKRNA